MHPERGVNSANTPVGTWESLSKGEGPEAMAEIKDVPFTGCLCNMRADTLPLLEGMRGETSVVLKDPYDLFA